MTTVKIKTAPVQILTDGENPYGTYTGSYSVTPGSAAVTLQTADKLVRRNITVQSIPVTETENDAGGTTVTIGGEA